MRAKSVDTYEVVTCFMVMLPLRSERLKTANTTILKYSMISTMSVATFFIDPYSNDFLVKCDTSMKKDGH